MAISNQIRNIIASNDALAREFGEGFDSVNSTLEWGFERVADEISALRAEFSYGMGLVLEQLRIQQRTLDGILDQLDAIHETLKHPLLTQARELSKRGMERLQRGLLPEALKDLLESAVKNETDFLVQLQIGKLYLYGQNPTDNVINLPSAEKHLRLAARYANSEIQHLPDAAKFCGEAFLHAAISCYAQANEKWLAKNVDTARRFIEQALELSQNATRIYPQLVEAFYNRAKFAALLGDGQNAQSSLKTAILADRNYCIKADADRDFDGVRGYVHNLFESLRQQAKQEATKALESAKKLLENYILQGTKGEQAESEIQKLIQQAEPLYRKDTYFDYLDALSLLKKAQQTFDQIPSHSRVAFKSLAEYSDKAKQSISKSEEALKAAEKVIGEAQKTLRKCNDKTLLDSSITAFKDAKSKSDLAKSKVASKNYLIEAIQIAKDSCEFANKAKNEANKKLEHYKKTRLKRVFRAIKDKDVRDVILGALIGFPILGALVGGISEPLLGDLDLVLY